MTRIAVPVRPVDGGHQAVCETAGCAQGLDGGPWRSEVHVVKVGAEDDAKLHRQWHRYQRPVPAEGGLTLARLRRIARAAGGRERRLTVITGPDGRRWAAWPYGCVELDDQRQGWLDRPVDGCYLMRADGLARRTCEESFGPALVRREMLPLTTAINRVSVVPTKWMYEDGDVVRRLLERSDQALAVVDADFWRLWNAVAPGPVWQVGSRNGALLWASSETAAATALLLPVRADVVPVPPAVTP